MRCSAAASRSRHRSRRVEAAASIDAGRRGVAQRDDRRAQALAIHGVEARRVRRRDQLLVRRAASSADFIASFNVRRAASNAAANRCETELQRQVVFGNRSAGASAVARRARSQRGGNACGADRQQGAMRMPSRAASRAAAHHCARQRCFASQRSAASTRRQRFEAPLRRAARRPALGVEFGERAPDASGGVERPGSRDRRAREPANAASRAARSACRAP
jgi:hypothetical protein